MDTRTISSSSCPYAIWLTQFARMIKVILKYLFSLITQISLTPINRIKNVSPTSKSTGLVSKRPTVNNHKLWTITLSLKYRYGFYL